MVGARTEGDKVIDFAEAMCRPSKLAAALRLREWQKQLLRDLFVLGADGHRRHRQALIGMPRKNGKSTLSASIALYGLLMDKTPGPEVYSVAGDRQQAGIVFREAKAMVAADPELSAECRVYVNHIETPSNGGIYRVLSAEAPRAQGLNPSTVIFDEVHVQPNRDLWDAMVTGMATREHPMILGITTAGYNMDTLCGELYTYGKSVLSGEIVDESFFMRWWEPSNPAADYRDPAVWAEANPAYDDFLHKAFFEDLVKSTPEAVFRRYYLNQWTSSAEAWLPFGAWEGIVDRARKVDPEEPVILFFDGSWTGDSVALVGCTIRNPHLFVVEHWVPKLDEPIDEDAVDAGVMRAHSMYNVKRQACDPFMWRRQIAGWRQRGLPVVEWPTNSPQRMVPACSEFYRAVLEHKVTHDGDPRLQQHLRNAVVKDDRLGRRIVKKNSTTKIDLAVAAVGAHDMARKINADSRTSQFHAF